MTIYHSKNKTTMKLNDEEKKVIINYMSAGMDVINLMLGELPKTPMNWIKILQLRNKRSTLETFIKNLKDGTIESVDLEKLI